MATINQAFGIQEAALAVRGYRQQLLASNIANADTPNYKSVDISFEKALEMARGSRSPVTMIKTSAMHLDGNGSGGGLAGIKPMYRTAVQPSIDGNTVDSNIEQAQFAENSLKYMATLQFINSKLQSTMLALRGNN